MHCKFKGKQTYFFSFLIPNYSENARLIAKISDNLAMNMNNHHIHQNIILMNKFRENIATVMTCKSKAKFIF